jgi:restriction system protein
LNSERNLIETENMQLEEWLDLIASPPPNSVFNDYSFPSDRHFQEYTASISEREEEEVLKLLRRFLIHTGIFGKDKSFFSFLADTLQNNPENTKQILDIEYNRRLIAFGTKQSQIPPWEGITWVLDLLPHSPKLAIDAIGAYFLAHARVLPDGRLAGLDEAMAIIRAKFIDFPRTKEDALYFLFDMDSRSFEHLVERLYNEIGYDTELSPPQKDGGRDVIAKNQQPGQLEHLLIECKRYKNPVGVEIARALLGVVSDEKVNKGVIVTTSRFTRGAKDLAQNNPRLELITGEKLIVLLNENFGPRWPLHIDRFIIESQKFNQ